MFLELDIQRVSRAFRGSQVKQTTTVLFFRGENKGGGGVVTLESVVLAPQNLGRRSTGILRFFENIAVKNPIQEMYDELENRGITPGEEVRFSSLSLYVAFTIPSQTEFCFLVLLLVHHCS